MGFQERTSPDWSNNSDRSAGSRRPYGLWGQNRPDKVLWGMDQKERDIRRVDEDEAEFGGTGTGISICHRGSPETIHLWVGELALLQHARCPGIVPAGTSGGR